MASLLVELANKADALEQTPNETRQFLCFYDLEAGNAYLGDGIGVLIR